MSVSLSLSHLSAGPLHPLTCRISVGERVLLASDDRTPVTTLLQVLCGEQKPTAGTAWLRWSQDGSRPFRTENVERTRLPRIWKEQVAVLWNKASHYEKDWQELAGRSPAVLLIEAPADENPFFAAALPTLLQQRKAGGKLTLVLDPMLRFMDQYDRTGLFGAGKLCTWHSPGQLSEKLSGSVWSVQVADMPRLEKDLPQWHDLQHFYRSDGVFRVITTGQNTAGNVANTGISVMSMTAWLAIRDHQDIVVRPATPILKDWLTLLC